MSYQRNIRDQDARVPERSLDQQESREIQPDASDLKQAREELAELVVAGQKVGRIDIEAALEAEMNADYRVFLADLTTLFHYQGQPNSDAWTFATRSEVYIKRIAGKHLSDSDVMDRAVANINERD